MKQYYPVTGLVWLSLLFSGRTCGHLPAPPPCPPAPSGASASSALSPAQSACAPGGVVTEGIGHMGGMWEGNG